MSEETTGEALIALKERAGLSLNEIAQRGGYKGPSSVQAMFNPDYDVKPLGMIIGQRLVDALVGLGDPPITEGEIWQLCIRGKDRNPKRSQPVLPLVMSSGSVSEVSPGPASLPSLKNQPRDIPVYGTALAADLEFDENGHASAVEQTLFEMGETITYARRPPGVSPDAKVYALYVSGSSMEPRYRPGDPLFVDPRKPPAIGDDVVVQLISENEDQPEISAGLIKTLVRRTGSYLELEQYRPEIRFRVPMERVAHIHRVIPSSELFGV